MRFLTIGLGHCGGKIASTFKKAAKEEEHLILDVCGINTDKVDLASHREIPEKNKLLIGSGRGAARDWNEGYNAGEEARGHIRNLLKKLVQPDTDIVMLTLGEGGGSGSGLAPIVAEIVGELGRECIALATLPFEVESVKSKVNAAKGLDLLYRVEALKALICIDNDKIVVHYPDSVLTEAYQEVNKTAVQTFINLLDLAHEPSQADRIDESELKAIFGYPGFATLANHRTYANMVSQLDSMLQHSWEGSLFADVNPTTATGVLLGVYGPSGLFTTTQVDNVRRVVKDMLIGKDAMLGVYPVNHCRWISYVGIMTGMDVPQKIKDLMGRAREEHQKQSDLLEVRRAQKARGLGFDLEYKPVIKEGTEDIFQTESRPKSRPRVDMESLARPILQSSVDISSTLNDVMEVVEHKKMEELSDGDLLKYIQNYIDESENVIAACIIKLKDMGCIIEPRRGMLKII
jgi:cell division protein FtsZ